MSNATRAPWIQRQLETRVDFETFFAQAPQLNPNVSKITGLICGYRVEEIDDPRLAGYADVRERDLGREEELPLGDEAGMELAVSTDLLLEGRHFSPGADPRRLGHKALAVNLSDLAAMGATPGWATLALAMHQASACVLITAASATRRRSLSFFESARPVMPQFPPSITAAA